jgi:hypothetical protein
VIFRLGVVSADADRLLAPVRGESAPGSDLFESAAADQSFRLGYVVRMWRFVKPEA